MGSNSSAVSLKVISPQFSIAPAEKLMEGEEKSGGAVREVEEEVEEEGGGIRELEEVEEEVVVMEEKEEET